MVSSCRSGGRVSGRQAQGQSTHFSDIIDLAVDDEPAVVRRVVLGHLLQGVSLRHDEPVECNVVFYSDF
jgi:hypothetical protein